MMAVEWVVLIFLILMLIPPGELTLAVCRALRCVLRCAVRWVGAMYDWILGSDKETEARTCTLRDRQSFIGLWHGREH